MVIMNKIIEYKRVNKDVYKHRSCCTTCQIFYAVYKIRCDVCNRLVRHRPRASKTKQKYIEGRFI
jgi:hypothetical protein